MSKAKVAKKFEFSVGDRVIVTYGHGWDGPGVIEYIGVVYIIQLDNGQTGGFSLGQFELDILYDSPLSKALR